MGEVVIMHPGSQMRSAGKEPKAHGHVFILHQHGRDEQYCILSQQVARATRVINLLAKGSDFDSVSIASVYDAAQKNAWTKRKWRVERLPLGQPAINRFNELAKTHKQALVCGVSSRYTFTSAPN